MGQPCVGRVKNARTRAGASAPRHKGDGRLESLAGASGRTSMTSLRARLAIGAQWTISIRIVDRVIGFASTLILARLLAPEDFGVVAMGTAVHGILASFTEFGFTQSLIRIRRPRPDAYSTAFTLHAAVCAAVAVALVSLAPVANAWYGDSRVVIVLLTLAVISLISGLRN